MNDDYDLTRELPPDLKHDLPPDPFIALEGCADYFFGRPVDMNPYARPVPNHPKATTLQPWESWRFGWFEGAWFNAWRGTEERRRWRIPRPEEAA